MSALIELRRAGRTFAGQPPVVALHDVSLSVLPGDFLVITGPSGCGKSTLLAIMGCLDTPTSGAVLVAGRDAGALSDAERSRLRARRLGFVFQQFHLLPHLTAQANVELALLYRGLGRHERRQRALRALASVGLGNRAEHRPQQLSGGEQQRVAIARAVVTEPDVVLADEPTGNLDSKHAAIVIDVLAQVVAGSRSLVVVTHSDEVAARGSRTVRLRDGRLAGEALVNL